MNMMKKCVKFHVDILSRHRPEFISASAIELSETATFVYNFVQYRNPIQAANFGGRFD